MGAPMSNMMSESESIDITSEALDLSQINFTQHGQFDDEDLYSEGVGTQAGLILNFSQQLQSAIKESCSPKIEEFTNKIASIDVDLSEKCPTYAVRKLLPENSQLAVSTILARVRPEGQGLLPPKDYLLC